MKAKMPIILSQMDVDGGESIMNGILGLSPKDDSSGPLLINYLYDNDKIDKPVFSISPGKEPKITFGGYQPEGLETTEQKFYSELLHPITALRIGGSFHWEVPIIAINVGGVFFRPSVNNAMLDTGTSIIVMG